MIHGLDQQGKISEIADSSNVHKSTAYSLGILEQAIAELNH